MALLMITSSRRCIRLSANIGSQQPELRFPVRLIIDDRTYAIGATSRWSGAQLEKAISPLLTLLPTNWVYRERALGARP